MKQKDVVVGEVYLTKVGEGQHTVKVMGTRESYSGRTTFVVAKCSRDGTNVQSVLSKGRAASALHPLR